MEGSTARAVAIAAVLGGLVGLLLGWQGHHAASGSDAETQIVRGQGFVHPDGEYLYIDTDGDGMSDHEAGGLGSAEWHDGESWHGPSDGLEQDCLPSGAGGEMRRVRAGLVDVPPFGGGAGRPIVVWFRCPGTF